mmetsp:Transcript_4102/g.5773  ORF Transcript_4102/g.5773 Transcript_4102/m.5773 type:complete len:359 (+) Transcript_4102:1102-2178(+)
MYHYQNKMNDTEANNIKDSETQKLTTTVKGIVLEKPQDVVKVAVHRYMKYLIYFMTFGGAACIFGAMLFYYLSLSTNVLLTIDGLSECSSSSEIVSFPQLNQETYFSPLLFVNGEEVEQLYAYSYFSACGSSSSIIPTYTSADNSQYATLVGTFKNNAALESMQVFLVGNPYSGNIYASYEYSYSNRSNDLSGTDDAFSDSVTNPSGCFQLTCKLGIIPYFNSSSNSTNKGTPTSVLNTGDTFQYMQIIGTMSISEQTISAQCSVSIYGQLVPYYSISKSVQPTGIYKCTVPEKVASAVGSAVALTMSTLNILTMVGILLLLWYGGGIEGAYHFLTKGGVFSMKSIKTQINDSDDQQP